MTNHIKLVFFGTEASLGLSYTMF